jgi:D-tyrosyl-tRNA(Tyr) deacylase
MRAILQRTSQASVTIAGEVVAEIGSGLLVLLGIEDIDTLHDAEWLAGKIANMRIFEDSEGRMNLSLLDTGGEALVVSQFTLHASTKKGNRPSFIRAAKPDHSEPLYDQFCEILGARLGSPAARGQFGALMDVALLNTGPVTILLDSKARE